MRRYSEHLRGVRSALVGLVVCLVLTLTPQASAQRNEGLFGVINAIAEVQGGRVKLFEIDTMFIEGRYRRDDRSWPFTLAKRKPDLARFVAQQSEGDFILVHDGEQVYEKLPFADEFSKLNAQDTARFLRHVYVVSGLWQLFESNQPMNYEGTGEIENTRCYFVSVETQRLGKLRFAVDASRSLVIRADHQLPGDDSYSEIIRYGRYRDVGSLRLPHQISVFRGDWEYERFEVERVEVNPGIYTSVFEPNLN